MENSPIPEAKFMELPKRWPLVTTLNSRNGSFTKDSRLVNAYAEKDASEMLLRDGAPRGPAGAVVRFLNGKHLRWSESQKLRMGLKLLH